MAATSTTRERVARYVVIVLLAVLVLVIPARCSLGSRDSYVDEAAAERADAALLSERAASARAAAASDTFAESLAAARVAVPTQPDLAGLIDAVGSAAASSDVVVTSGSPARTSEEGEASTEWTLSLGVDATVETLPAFLDALVSLDRLVVVDSVDQSVAADGVVRATVNARFFSLEGS